METFFVTKVSSVFFAQNEMNGRNDMMAGEFSHHGLLIATTMSKEVTFAALCRL